MERACESNSAEGGWAADHKPPAISNFGVLVLVLQRGKVECAAIQERGAGTLGSGENTTGLSQDLGTPIRMFSLLLVPPKVTLSREDTSSGSKTH